VEDDTIFRGLDSRGSSYALHLDLTVYGKTSGCFNADCTKSDKFNAEDEAECASTCNTAQECNFWAFGEENGAKKCWLRTGDGGREARSGARGGSRHCAPSSAFVANPQRRSALQGTWEVTYSNGHRDAYVIDSFGRAKRPNGMKSGQLTPQGSDADTQRDHRYAGKFFLPSTHRPGVWEYVWLHDDTDTLMLRHFCVDGQCSNLSPEGSANFCCTGTGTRVGEGPVEL
jgi:hypothetical protein